ncbi:MAG: CBS domain-containing protein [Lachnospiraceae bacterium]|jgi:CBS domain-containing protein|nr:CBS domain-containing protein [Lachnospiraceae bacterium]
MNILFFLTPKRDVDMIYEGDTLGEALDRMASHEFTCLPIVNEKTGRYVGTISEGDILRDLTRGNGRILGIEKSRPVMSIHRKRDFIAISANSDMEELFSGAANQNFIPVTDDSGTFIGIITRKSIIEFMTKCCDTCAKNGKEAVPNTDARKVPVIV